MDWSVWADNIVMPGFFALENGPYKVKFTTELYSMIVPRSWFANFLEYNSVAQVCDNVNPVYWICEFGYLPPPIWFQFSNGVVVKFPAARFSGQDDGPYYYMDVVFDDTIDYLILGGDFLYSYAMIMDGVKSRVGFVPIPGYLGEIYNPNNIPLAIQQAIEADYTWSPPEEGLAKSAGSIFDRKNIFVVALSIIAGLMAVIGGYFVFKLLKRRYESNKMIIVKQSELRTETEKKEEFVQFEDGEQPQSPVA